MWRLKVSKVGASLNSRGKLCHVLGERWLKDRLPNSVETRGCSRRRWEHPQLSLRTHTAVTEDFSRTRSRPMTNIIMLMCSQVHSLPNERMSAVISIPASFLANLNLSRQHYMYHDHVLLWLQPLACITVQNLTQLLHHLTQLSSPVHTGLLGLGLGLEAKFSGLGLGLEISGLGLGL